MTTELPCVPKDAQPVLNKDLQIFQRLTKVETLLDGYNTKFELISHDVKDQGSKLEELSRKVSSVNCNLEKHMQESSEGLSNVTKKVESTTVPQRWILAGGGVLLFLLVGGGVDPEVIEALKSLFGGR